MNEEKKRATAERLESVGIKEIKIVNGKYVFIFESDLVAGDNGDRYGNTSGLPFGMIGLLIESFIGKKVIFRMVSKDSSLEEVLSNGVDNVGIAPIQDKKTSKQIFASEFLEKAIEYAHHSTADLERSSMKRDHVVAIYDRDSVCDNGNFIYEFDVEPLDALKGVLVIKSKKK